MLLMMSILCDVLCFVDAATNGFKISPYNNTISSDNSEWPSDITSQNPILTESAAELMEVFREKSNHEGVVSVYEAMIEPLDNCVWKWNPFDAPPGSKALTSGPQFVPSG